MRVLNVNSYYLSSSLYQPMEDSLKQYHDISTYVPTYPKYKVRDEIDYPLPKHVTVSNCFKKNDRILFFRKHFKIKKDIKKFYNINEYDALHAHSLFSNGYIAYSIGKQFQIPYIVAVRSTDLNVFFKKMLHLRYLGIKILLNANSIVFLSKSHRDECLEKYIPGKYKETMIKKSKVIPNGIDQYWFENKNINLSTPKDKIRVVFVGNDSKRKNLKTLVDACDLLIKHYDLELTIVGKVNEKTKETLKEKDYINIVGHIEKEKILLLYRESNVFVLPSINETFGLVYPEAMTQGLPVIYTRGQGFDQHFKEGEVGNSVKCLDPHDIAKKILLNYKEHGIVSKRNINLVDKFRWDNIVKKYNLLYQDLN